MAAALGGLVGVTAVAAVGAQFLSVLSTREGALRSVQIPLVNGFIDYVTLLNEGDVGTAPWMRGLLRGLLTAEALRTAMRHFGHQPLTGAQVQWGFEHLTLTAREP